MAKAIPLPVVQTGFEQSIEAGKKAVGTLNIPVNIDPSPFKNLNQPLGKITGLATEFEKSIAASNARVLAFGASVGILNAISKGFKSILDNGIAVEKALGDIGAVSGQSAAQLDQLGDALFNVAKNTSQSFNTAAKAALEFSRQGLSVEETVKRTNDALTLTRFTSLSAADSVDTLTAAVNSFAGAGITTTQILNKLIAVDSAFAVSAEDLANGLARAGSIAQEVGVTFDELNGLITVAQEKTARGGAVIGNALKTIFTRVRSDETISALRAVGVESLDTAGNLRDVVPILTDLSIKLKDLSGGERIQILEAVASKYNINILSALLGDIGNAESQFKKALGTGLGATNEATARQVELNKTLDAVLNQTSVSAGELANNLAKIGLNDNLKSLVGYVNSFLDSINKLLSSTDTGGDLARGIIKGFSDVLFKVGLPLIAAIFIKLTKDIATFGIESLQTILGINQKVKERQALEQAVTATLISNKGIMDQILAASGNQVKQQEILLKAYGDQIAALKTIQSISASVAPALQGAGLVVTPNGVGKKDGGKGKAAEGYLPAQEAADVRRGVGGASSSSKVVSIPNFAFGGGKKGTMIANTSEYVVPNFANGGSAIFNQDMVKAYGLPAGAKKIGAANGYIPNFAKYIYDSDRIPADKNATLKAILASSAKKNLLIAPAGAGKSTLAAGMGTFLTGAADVANATEIDILSGAGRTKDGGLSKNLESIMAAVNASGGKVSYLYTKNLDILSRRAGRTDPSEGDLRSKKQIAGTAYAPLNQFDFMGMVKSKANSFSMVRGAEGFVPNFAEELTKFGASTNQSRYAAMVGEKIPANLETRFVGIEKNGELAVKQNKFENSKFVQFPVIGLPERSSSNINSLEDRIEEFGKSAAVNFASNLTGNVIPKEKVAALNDAKFNPGSLAAFAGTLFEASIGSMLGDKGFADYNAQSIDSAFDIKVNDQLKQTFPSLGGVDYVELKGRKNKQLMDSVAKKIYKVTEGQRAAQKQAVKKANTGAYIKNAYWFVKDGVTYAENDRSVGEDISYSKVNPNSFVLDPKTVRNQKQISTANIRGAAGYIPNFARGGPLEDAIQREMAAGLDPSQIRVTTDGKLKSPSNPNGFAVINTRDEPNGRIPNFAKNEAKIRKEILGKGTAEGPLLPKGYQIPQNSGGYTFDYGVGSAQANPSASPEVVAKTEADKKAALSTGKLTAAFSALTVASFTLQSTLKDSDNIFAKTINSLTQIGSTAAGYGSIASLAGESFAKRGGLLGKAAGYMGPAGLVAGAGIGIYQSFQEADDQRRNAIINNANQAGSTKASAGIQYINTASATNEEKLINLQRKATESRGGVAKLNVEEDRQKAIELNAIKSNNAKQEIQAQQELFRIAQDKLQAIAELNTYETAIISLYNEQNALEERAKKLTDEEAKNIAKKIPLEKEIYRIINAIAQNEADASVKSAKDYAQRIQTASSLSSLAEEYNAFLIGRDQIQEKINNLEKESLDNVLTELAKKATSSVNKDELEILLNKLKNGEDLVNVQKELDKLGLGSLKTNEKLIQDEQQKINLKRIGLKADKEIYQTNELSKIQIRDQNSLFKDRLDLIQNLISIESRKRSFDADQKAEQDSLNRQIAIRNIREDIASKPFASNADKVRLLEAEKAFALAEETARISEASNKRALDGYDKRLNAVSNLIANEKLFSQEQTKSFQAQIKAANELPTTEQRNKALSEISTNIGKSNLDIPAPIAPTKPVFSYNQYDTDANNVEMQIYEEKMKKFRVEDEAYRTRVSSRASALTIQLEKQQNIEADINKELETATGTDKLRIEAIKKAYDYEQKIAILRAKSPATAGAVRAMDQIDIEASNFTENFSYNTTLGFRDGLRDALDAAVSGTDDLRGALEGVAKGFLRTMQQAFLQNASNNVMQGLSSAFPKIFQTKSQGGYIQKFASGGFVTGGSGIRDDVPAMLSSGEYVMRKSAVQKYGAENMAKMNNGGIFLPGVRGGSEISGYDQLSKFANQTTTSGATDVLKGGRSSAFANLEDQSVRLSRFGLMNEDTIKGEITSAQQQGLELIAQREAYRTQQRKAMQQQIVGTALSLALSAGTNALGSKGSAPKATGMGAGTKASDLKLLNSIDTSKMFKLDTNSSFMNFTPGKAYGGMIRGFNNGGGPTDDIPALLMGGEYVMDRGTVRKYGKQYLDSMNSGRAKFAEGGYAGAETETTTESTDSKAKVDANTGTAVNISINVSGGNSSTESQGQTSQGGVDYKKMSERIKAVVLETLNEEKRLGGSLRTR
jgi:TP901 family phage tail tape measure protein